MASERTDEAVLVRYLLGRLSDEEQVTIEDRAFSDADWLAALEAAEADLIDAYVRGELSESDSRAFERRFLTSAERRKKLDFAIALARVGAESRAPQTVFPEPQSGWRALLAVVRGWNPSMQVAAAAVVLICVVGISWLVTQNAALRSRIPELEAERRDAGVREKGLQRRLAEEQARVARLSDELQSQPSSEGAAATVASLVLLPGLSRTQGRPEQLVVTPSTQLLRIEIQLEARDAYPAFRAELRTRGGDEVLTRSNLFRRRTGAAHALVFDVPASAVAAGEYELALKGVTAEGSADDIGYYYFSVRK
jgi:hypothetical protein